MITIAVSKQNWLKSPYGNETVTKWAVMAWDDSYQGDPSAVTFLTTEEKDRAVNIANDLGELLRFWGIPFEEERD